MINILVTLNANYIPPLKVMLHSLFSRNRNETIHVYLMHSTLSKEQLLDIEQFIQLYDQHFHPIFIDDTQFQDAPVFRHYTVEMYYRLAAHLFLPQSVDRILYLDPDIVVINPIKDFYEMDFEGNLFIASEHEHTTKIVQPINKFRLKTPAAKGYFNTGVLLMNIELMRRLIQMDVIYSFIKENKRLLILPDQDILNGLYWDKIKPVDSFRYNYDARYFELAKLYPMYKKDLVWIKMNTLFIHYCGKDKPWHNNYKGTLGFFYNYYEKKMNEKLEGSIFQDDRT
ncbi:glycosyltransferase family 8 protein [Fervidibacillus halotolerans]|uniref:Glycosyltransferase family 8 protein n=1 Tax=Fervidibacillus halotolerans TaxID=2980027 RepID=A0A9E8M228_9BACI|nr:glycosyltransferase family 8 protein [Fervidibacillus halotolerans]WAA13992.1 glycosyltransferase family 8 protein [Fervidibacillus halotolerans]